MEQQSWGSFSALVGLDWADQKHDIQLLVNGDSEPQHQILTHSPEAIADWARSLKHRFGEQARIGVCLELTKGPVVSALQKHELFIIFPVNPTTLAKYRQAWSPSRAKDDPSDARLLLDLLLLHPDRVKPLQSESIEMRTLAHLVEMRRRLVDDRVKTTNRLTAALKNYFPQVLSWFEDKSTTLFIDFVARWSSLPEVQRARTATLEKFFTDHNVRRRAAIQARIEAIRTSTTLTDDPAVIGPNHLHVKLLVAQLRLLAQSIATVETELSSLCAKIIDYDFFAALPGAGPALAPRLLVAFGQDRQRFLSARALAQHVGIAPVTERSGKKSWAHRRISCNKFMRQTLVEWVAQTVPRSVWAGAFYRQQRAKGAAHHVALRALAYKWLRILFRCWQDSKHYDESIYLKALAKAGSPLVSALPTTVVST